MTKEIILALMAGLQLIALLQDATMLKISNAISVAVVALFLVWASVCGWELSLWQNGTSFALALAAGLFLFSREWMGGGDVKLFAANALWFDLHGLIFLIGAITIVGGIFAVLLVTVRRMMPASSNQSSLPPVFRLRGPIPYGVAIAIGTVVTLYMSGPNPSGIAALPTFIHG